MDALIDHEAEPAGQGRGLPGSQPTTRTLSSIAAIAHFDVLGRWMFKHYQLICRALEELAERSQASDPWITFEANGQEHWLQCARGQINMDWPFSQAPEPQLLQKHFDALAPFEVVAWDTDLYATIKIAESDTDLLVVAIDRIFRDLYELGPDYDLCYKLQAT